MEKRFEFAWHSAVFLLVCLSLFVLAKLIFKVINAKLNIKSELVDKDNLSFFVAYVCYFAGILSIIGGVMNSEGAGDFWSEILLSVIYGVVGILVLNFIAFITDRFLHPSVELWKSVEQGSVAIGVLKGGNYLSTGIIVGGVMLTEVDKPFEATIFLAFAIVISFLGYFYYNLITPFSTRSEIYKGNEAVAISSTGAQLAFAILIYAGFQIEHSTWVDSIIGIGIDVLAGFILIPLIRFIVDKVFVPSRKITDELINQEKPNVGLGLFEAVAYIGGALLFIWCWNL